MIRQDAWNEEEDRLLANTVIQFISEGKTQLQAFQDVATALSRTAAACGFRWNSAVRKQYRTEISNAKQSKKQRRMSKVEMPLLTDVPEVFETVEKGVQSQLDDVIAQLVRINEQMKAPRIFGEELQSSEWLTRENADLREEIELLHQRLSAYEAKYNHICLLLSDRPSLSE
ncbi:MAG: RsfA family transcriptional regulator [Bacilli bacterium]